LRRALALAQSALGRVRQTSARLAEILDTNRTRPGRGWRPAVAVVAGLTVAVFAALPYAPEIVGFSNPPVRSALSPLVSAPPSRRSDALPKPVAEVRKKGVLSKHLLPKVVPASARWSQKQSPKMLVRRVSYQAGNPSEVLFVVETRETYDSGQAVWTLSVWRICAGGPAGRNIEENIVLNSI
jgi:hypothetical protein